MSTKLEYILGAIVLVMALFLGYEQYHKAIENAKAETKAEADKAEDMKLESSLKARDSVYQAQVADYEKRLASIQKLTSAQIVERVPIYIPQATAPIRIVGPDTEPAKTGDAIVPALDIKPMAEAVVAGEQCKLDRAKCTADLGDWQRKYELADDEGKQWKKAAKGGSVWHRAKGKLTVGAVGAVVGAGLYAYFKGRKK